MNVAHLQRQWRGYTKYLFMEGYLDDQFLLVQQLQDEEKPDFVVELASLFFHDSQRILDGLTNALNQESIDFKKVDSYVHQFRGSSSSIGAQRVKNACIVFRNFCEEKDANSCHKCLQQVKQEYCLFKSKLETLFSLEHQIVGAGGSIPVMSS
ncbi:Histidine-containing phosphotransfer protein 1 [Senna tora]|uniref:Histidine-containing phosphotransfer protein n=1 Tax=Senna tora TaxID=362788 RepID=A0A834T298_9FABA|nr:Histidine-containing phosphotransfer protein 1 [Senna tora]